ncbi:amyloid beta A4 protein-like isoform X2 [Mizuhopecten yessoensis]|uniref:Amyloid-like protein 1 n=1 Tax=Mizuhopecten yessoensis TaxID=6573 RepID=A0A210QLZ4_MIZYE|nr:amyloid beta A4 protein-like isoform X2 [Mizuhopecten yessoensis]OWF49758.1 Amyloid-like protein 1 [Mizuhopecten yessoensis]
MGPNNGPLVLIVVLATLKALAANVDAVSQNTKEKLTHMVAYSCDQKDAPLMYKRADQKWEAAVTTRTSTCLDNLQSIFDYCKEVYTDADVTNIVPVENVEITWPDKFGHLHTDRNFQVYSCLTGIFTSAALLVPQGCEFQHLKYNECAAYTFWKENANMTCRDKSMYMQDFSMLLPCDVGMYAGVEYVCCKPAHTETPIDHPGVVSLPKEDKAKTIIVDKDANVDDAYQAYLRNDEEYLARFRNEHERFKNSELALNKRHQDRINKMMKEWEEARAQIAEMKKTDVKGAEALNADVMKRFQLLYTGYEQADAAEKRQLVALHLQRRQGELNRRKRVNLEKYMTELQRPHVDVQRVFKFLKEYIKVEEKDRAHTLNHFVHVRNTDIEEAKRIQKSSLDHLSVLDQRINQALDMLNHFNKIKLEVRPMIDNFLREYEGLAESAREVVSRPFTPEVDSEEEGDSSESQEDLPAMDNNVNLGPMDTVIHKVAEVVPLPSQDDINNDILDDNVREDDGINNFDEETIENEHDTNFVAHHMDDKHMFQQPVGKVGVHIGTATGSIFGIAIGSVAVFVIIVVAVIMLRKHSHRRPVTHGFVEVDPAASPEERHVANMQMNGYENPTYQYFELNQNQNV